MKLTTKQLVETALILAICIVSQFFKNTSVFITGPIINAAIILEVLAVGLAGGIVLSVITPITSFFITGSPVIAAIPSILPAIMVGNIILTVCTYLFSKNFNFSFKNQAGMVVGTLLKSLFMGVVIALILVPMFGSAFPAEKATAIKMTFSVIQLITGLIGSVYATIIWIPLKKTQNQA